MSSIQRQCWRNAQYSQRKFVEVMGLPLLIEDKKVEPTVCRVLQHIGVDITGESIEGCHRLIKQSGRAIVKFSRRKDCQHVMRKKLN